VAGVRGQRQASNLHRGPDTARARRRPGRRLGRVHVTWQALAVSTPADVAPPATTAAEPLPGTERRPYISILI